MPNVRIHNTVANVGLRGTPVNVRVSQAGGCSVAEQIIPTGTPIGLLLALTYANPVTVPPVFFSDLRPHVNIRTI